MHSRAFKATGYVSPRFGVLALAIVLAIAAGPVTKAWVEDRKDRRKYAFKQQELIRKISEKRDED